MVTFQCIDTTDKLPQRYHDIEKIYFKAKFMRVQVSRYCKTLKAAVFLRDSEDIYFTNVCYLPE